MPDLRNQLRSALDAAEPVTKEEAISAARRRSIRRRLVVAGASVAVVAAAIVVPLATRSTPHRLLVAVRGGGMTVVPTNGGPAQSTASANGVTTTVALTTTMVPTGTTISGTLTVDNETGRTLGSRGETCPQNVFRVGLSGHGVSTFVGFTTVGCLPPYSFLVGPSFFVGSTVLPFTLSTLNSGGPPGSRFLPPGRYPASLRTNGYDLPIPPSIIVTVTPKLSTLTPKLSTLTPTLSPTSTQVALPDVVGLDMGTAINRLTDLGLTVQASPDPALTRSPGTVITESPGGGSVVAESTSVSIVYAGAGQPVGPAPGTSEPSTATVP